MIKSIGKEINTILGGQTILIWTYGIQWEAFTEFKLGFDSREKFSLQEN